MLHCGYWVFAVDFLIRFEEVVSPFTSELGPGRALDKLTGSSDNKQRVALVFLVVLQSQLRVVQ